MELSHLARKIFFVFFTNLLIKTKFLETVVLGEIFSLPLRDDLVTQLLLYLRI